MVEELERVEDAFRRSEGKRKDQAGTRIGRKSKRRKFEKLVDWGETVLEEVEEYRVEDMVCKLGTSLAKMQEEVNLKLVTTVKERIILETEMMEEKMLQKRIKKKSPVKSKKFKLRTKRKLNKAEEKELSRTHGGGAFDWLKRSAKSQAEIRALDTRLEWENEIRK